MTNNYTILGIDPGTATTGFGIISADSKNKNVFTIVDFGVIQTKPGLSDSQRLVIIGNDLEALIEKFKPSFVGVEKLFFTTNQKTAMSVAQARGVALYVCSKHDIPLFEFTPLQVKNIVCGYGKADKRQIQFMVKKTFGLPRVPKPDDAADALAIALCVASVKNTLR